MALSCESPRLAVSQHPALRSPDLPQHDPALRSGLRPPGRLTVPASLPLYRAVRRRRTAASVGCRRCRAAPVSSSIPRPRAAAGGRPAAGRLRPEATARPAADVLSIGALYDEVEAALASAFPRNRQLWVRGEIHSLSDQWPLGPSLSGPGRPRRRGAGAESARRAAGACRPSGSSAGARTWGPLRRALAKAGDRAGRGHGGGAARHARPLPRRRARSASSSPSSTSPRCWAAWRRSGPQLLRTLEAEGLLGATRRCPCPRSRCAWGWWPARAPRATATSWAS